MEHRRRQRYLRALGIDAWVPRDGSAEPLERYATDDSAPAQRATVCATEAQESEPVEMEPELGVGAGQVSQAARENANDDIEQLDWEQLGECIRTCRRCELHQGRKHTVFGAGVREAELMVVGEGPGAEEDRRGEAFVGRAGKLLDEMLFAIGCNRRDSVFIANIVKCRPPGNRDPRPEEVAACERYLRRQIDLVHPRVIVAVGRVAAQNLLNTQQRLGALRGREHEYQGAPVIVTYHPAYLLRSPQDKRKAWEDLKRVRARLERSA